MVRFLLLPIVLLFISDLDGQKPDHFYVYLQDILEDQVVIDYGDFILGDDKLKKDKTFESEVTFFEQVKEAFAKLPKERQNIAIYIHGLWADADSFNEPCGYILTKDVLNQPESPYGLTISLQWSGTLNYIEDYPITKSAGQKYTSIMQKLSEHLIQVNPSYQSAYLLHSMGHQVFYYLIKQGKNTECSIPVNKLILCAGDIRDTILQDEILKDIISNSLSTTVFHHQKDRTLRMAKSLVKGERLGITGPKDPSTLPSHVSIIDVTDYDDFESIPGSISLHRYFYDSPKVRQILKEILSTLE